MERDNIQRLAMVLAVQAEIEGMKAKNVLAEMQQRIPDCNEDDFNHKAEQLKNIAFCPEGQLSTLLS